MSTTFRPYEPDHRCAGNSSCRGKRRMVHDLAMDAHQCVAAGGSGKPPRETATCAAPSVIFPARQDSGCCR